MRELLFRGKNLKNGEWVIGHSIYVRYCQEKIDTIQMVDEKTDLKFMNRYFEIDQNTVGQWTGLVDSKANKIFEGDIITHRNMIYSIGYKNGMLCLSDKYTDGIPHMIHNGRMECIVIGNIYDNPELLEEDKR